MTFKNGVVIMTALPPTEGHLRLIEFAAQFVKTRNDGRYECGQLIVIINGRSFEPKFGWNIGRAMMVQMELHARHLAYNIEVVYDETDDAPQNPEDHPDFWEWWKSHINSIIKNHTHRRTSLVEGDYLFASEPYGAALAATMGLEFVPYDMNREIVHARATEVRANHMDAWNQMIPEVQRFFHRRITIFGAESCGKTTMAKRLRDEFLSSNGETIVKYLPEWARGYLETVGAELSEGKMDTIMRGQFAMMKSHMYSQPGLLPFVVQDTDLISTLGYYRICGMPVPDDLDELIEESRSHLYFVMNSNIPFEADPLRYGGQSRESSDQFWIDLLNEKSCKYHVVTETDPDLQFAEVKRVILEYCAHEFATIRNFKRT